MNWGKAIFLSFVLFAAFILYFVIKTTLDDRLNHELVDNDYYKQEQNYQSELEMQKRALLWNLRCQPTEKGIEIVFPDTLQHDKFLGQVELYRPSNENLDKSYEIKLEGYKFKIPLDSLVSGRWDVTIRWRYDKDKFMIRKSLTLP